MFGCCMWVGNTWVMVGGWCADGCEVGDSSLFWDADGMVGQGSKSRKRMQGWDQRWWWWWQERERERNGGNKFLLSIILQDHLYSKLLSVLRIIFEVPQSWGWNQSVKYENDKHYLYSNYYWDRKHLLKLLYSKMYKMNVSLARNIYEKLIKFNSRFICTYTIFYSS